MSTVFSKLTRYQPRSFVPDAADLLNKDVIVNLCQQLLDRPVNSQKDLERWILDRSELGAAVGQAGSIIYIEMTCDTSDESKVKAYQAFIQEIEPAVKPLDHAMNKRFLELIARYPLDPKRYEIYQRSTEAAVKLFVEANIPLQTEVAMLSQEYQSVCGAMMVLFDGVERTLPEMSKFLMENDRPLRERAWRAVAERRLQDKDKLEGLFDKMRALRDSIARNAGFKNFRDYQFAAYQRFDYTPQDCKAYHQAVKELIVPLRRKIDQARKKAMRLDVLRPWDGAVDPLGREPLKPFGETRQLIDGVCAVVSGLDPELAALYADMDAHGLLDLASRKGKAPGGYQNTLDEARKPFIFMNAVGVDDDVRTLLHESGHAFHAYLSSKEPLAEYRHAPMEFCEVASMSMELMASDFLAAFYSPDDTRRSAIEHLEGVISTLAWVATVDAFQHWIYENPSHTADERRQAWQRLNTEFGGGVVDWSGLDEERAYAWHRQLHIFEVPFYYIEYGIAQLGALQIWQKFRRDPKGAVADYKRGLGLGGSRPLPELFEAAGIQFGFSKEMIAPLMKDVHAEWERLSA